MSYQLHDGDMLPPDGGYNAFEIAALLGHTNIQPTRRYVRVEPRCHDCSVNDEQQEVKTRVRRNTFGSQIGRKARQPLRRVAVNH